MPKSYQDWIDFYGDENNDDVNISNDHANALLSLTDIDDGASAQTIFALLTSNPTAGFLAASKHSNDQNKIVTGHHIVSRIPSMVIDVHSNQFFAILGFDNDPPIISVEPGWFTDPPENNATISTPTTQAIIEAIGAGLAPTQVQPTSENYNTMSPTKATTIPPFLLLPIASSDPTDFNGIIKNCLQAIEQHKNKKNRSAHELDELTNQCGRFIQFLWIHAQNKTNIPTLSPQDIDHINDPAITTKMATVATMNGIKSPEPHQHGQTQIPVAFGGPPIASPPPIPTAITPTQIAFASPMMTTNSTANQGNTPNTNTTTQLAAPQPMITMTTNEINELVMNAVNMKLASTVAHLIQGDGSSNEKSSKSKWHNRITTLNQRIILHASQPVDERYRHTNTIITEPNQEYKELIETPKSSAQETLSAAIESARKCNLTIDINLTSNIWNGTLRNPHHDIPMRLSVFFCAPREIAGTNIDNPIEWDLKIQTNNVSAEQIKQATKSKIVVPKDLPSLLKQLQNFRGLLDLLFTHSSAPYKAVNAWITEIDNEHELYRSMIAHNDQSFIAGSILSNIDRRIQQFLTKCMDAKHFHEINYGILDFTEDFETHRGTRPIMITIPALVREAMKPQNNQENQRSGNSNSGGGNASKNITPPSNKGGSSNKRGGSHDQHSPNTVTPNDNKSNKKPRIALGNLAKNPDAKPEWVTKATTDFAPFRKQVDSIPKTPDGETICVKYHVSGSCLFGDACTRVRTHKKLDTKTLAELTKWVAKCTSTVE